MTIAEAMAKTLWDSLTLEDIRTMQHALDAGAQEFLHQRKALPWYNLEPDEQRLFIAQATKLVYLHEATRTLDEEVSNGRETH